MKVLGIIPARFASTRFPAKALVDIGGKPMVQRVYEQASKARLLSKVVVATDHEKIKSVIEGFNGQVVMTSENHPTGTDRCFEALTLQADDYDYVINIQGDEPFIQPESIDELAGLLDGHAQLATLVTPFKNSDQLFNPNLMKVIFDKYKNAIYFSREVVPHLRGVEKSLWAEKQTYFKHVCMYAYRADILAEITQLGQSTLEIAESLEQLRWIENGYKIKIGITDKESMSIDTPEDLERALKVYGITD